MREVEAIVKGISRTVGAEQRIRGKKPLRRGYPQDGGRSGGGDGR
jgi:hypothetical protein